MADFLATAGITHLVTIDLYPPQCQAFFRCPVDNIKAWPLMVEVAKTDVEDWQSAVIVAKNPGAVKRAAVVAKKMRLHLAMIFGEVRGLRPPLLAPRVLTAGAGC